MAGVGVEAARKRVQHYAREVILRQPPDDVVAEPAKGRTILFRHDVLVEGAEQDEHVVVAGADELHYSLKGGPLQGLFRFNPLETRRALAGGGPRFVAVTVGPAFGIGRGLWRDTQGDLREAIFVGVRVLWRAAAVLFESPGKEAFLSEAGHLQMIG